jgi:hypothetical protein
MRERREKGLCYYCDDKYSQSHVCKTPRIFLIQGMEWEQDMADNSVCIEEEGIEELGVNLPEISLHAISGTPTPHTMRVVGFIRGQMVVILIDSGSTHNFLDPSIVKKTQLSILSHTRITVKVANGDTIQSEGQCSDVSLKVQGVILTTEFYILSLGGCDIRSTLSSDVRPDHLGFFPVDHEVYSFWETYNSHRVEFSWSYSGG